LYKRNLVKELAKLLGMSTKNIEVKNIVVGDLPYDKLRGDFYVAISVGTNPDMVTSLQEEKMPKIVHFPEILQLKLRDSPLEPRVKITVKELNIAGSETLCELVVSPMSIIDWAADEEPLKRFQMKAVNSDIERETPPWIAFEMSFPTESRKLWDMPNIWHLLKVRTYLPPRPYDTEGAHAAFAATAANGPTPTAHPAQQKKESIMTSDGTILGTRKIYDENIAPFKFNYVLLDDSGNPVEEPQEDDLAKIRHMRQGVMYCFGCFQCLVFLMIIAYALFRFYVWSCYRQFVWMTEAQMNGMTFPISNQDLKDLVQKCHQAVDGTGTLHGTPCRPSYNQTLQVCESIPETNRPEAFVGLLYDWFGIHAKGITCFHGICEFRNKLVEYDYSMVFGAIGLIVLTRFAKCWADHLVKSYKKSCQAKAALKNQDRSKYSGTGASYYSGGQYGGSPPRSPQRTH